MADWKRYMGNHFGSCRVIAYAFDNCRGRDVSIFAVPGEFDDVGVSDGTDCWIAPAAASLFSVNVQRLMQDLQAGKPLPKPEKGATGPAKARRALLDDVGNIIGGVKPRTQVVSLEMTDARVRKNLEAAYLFTPTKERRHVK